MLKLKPEEHIQIDNSQFFVALCDAFSGYCLYERTTPLTIIKSFPTDVLKILSQSFAQWRSTNSNSYPNSSRTILNYQNFRTHHEQRKM
jgi:hypothetical protein